MRASSGVLNQGSTKCFLIIRPKKKQPKNAFFFNYLYTNNNTENQGLKVTYINNRGEFFDLHTEVRHTAGHKGIWVNVFMTGQKWKEKKCTAFLYGILHAIMIKALQFEYNAQNNREVQQKKQYCFSHSAYKDQSGSFCVKTLTMTPVFQ